MTPMRRAPGRGRSGWGDPAARLRRSWSRRRRSETCPPRRKTRTPRRAWLLRAHRTAIGSAARPRAHSSRRLEGSTRARDATRCANARRRAPAPLTPTRRDRAPSRLELSPHPLELADHGLDDVLPAMLLGKHVPGIGLDLEVGTHVGGAQNRQHFAQVALRTTE